MFCPSTLFKLAGFEMGPPTPLGLDIKIHASVVWCWDRIAKHISNPDVACAILIYNVLRLVLACLGRCGTRSRHRSQTCCHPRVSSRTCASHTFRPCDHMAPCCVRLFNLRFGRLTEYSSARRHTNCFNLRFGRFRLFLGGSSVGLIVTKYTDMMRGA